ncbi:MAG: sugar phosphate isomerase/epimerase [Lentisphaeria bacterium]|nr:sugar phosphate isomerase/epimerase [Lentisphaeria bacterium]
MLLTRPIHSAAFLKAHGLGVEAHTDRPLREDLVPLVFGVHLPYAGLNLAALDETLRRRSVLALKDALLEGIRFPVDRMVVHSCGIGSENGIRVGDYGLLVESFRELADFAARHKIILCIENQVLRPNVRRFCDNPAEWLALPGDIGRDNVMLTFDSSHAATSAAVFENYEDRLRCLNEFLSRPESIGRIHWSDARLKNREALYNDMHQVPGKGDLPPEFHRRIHRLPAVKLLEQKCTEAEVLEGLDFIAGLDG